MDGVRFGGCFDAVEKKQKCQYNRAILSHQCRQRSGMIEAYEALVKGDE